VALGVRLVRGRAFTSDERKGSRLSWWSARGSHDGYGLAGTRSADVFKGDAALPESVAEGAP